MCCIVAQTIEEVEPFLQHKYLELLKELNTAVGQDLLPASRNIEVAVKVSRHTQVTRHMWEDQLVSARARKLV